MYGYNKNLSKHQTPSYMSEMIIMVSHLLIKLITYVLCSHPFPCSVWHTTGVQFMFLSYSVILANITQFLLLTNKQARLDIHPPFFPGQRLFPSAWLFLVLTTTFALYHCDYFHLQAFDRLSFTKVWIFDDFLLTQHMKHILQLLLTC